MKKNILLSFVLVLVISCSTDKYISNEIIQPINAPFEMPELHRPVFRKKVYNISRFGAVNDGKTLNKTAINDAIKTCSSEGGGTVLVPSGKWLTVPIELKSNVNLHLVEGAEVIFTYEKFYYFPDSLSRVNGDLTRPLSPIYARDAENIAITGSGTLDGQGIGWWPLQEKWWSNHKKFHSKEFYESVWEGINKNLVYTNDPREYMEDQSNYGDERPVAIRPSMFKPVNCKNILLEGFTIKNSPMWTINPLLCENIIIRHLNILASTGYENHHTPNTDGINPESSRNVLIEYCSIITGDDSYAIKSGLDEAGRIRGVPSENIVIRHNKNRRISIGSEMSGGVRNVYVYDCEVVGMVNRAIHIKTVRGRGGVVENLWFENISFDTVKENAIYLNMFYGDREEEPVSERTPVFRNFSFKNISGNYSERPIAVMAIPEMPADSLLFEKINIPSELGIICHNGQNIVFKDVFLSTVIGPSVLIDNGLEIDFSDIKFDFIPEVFLEVSGPKTGNIRINKNINVTNDKLVFINEAKPASVQFTE